MVTFSTDYLHHNAGPSLVVWSAVGLGWTRDGLDIAIQPKWADVQSDDYGGQGGAPSDSQLLGAIAQVRVELVKYNRARVEQLSNFSPAGLESGASAGIAGSVPEIGAFVRQDGLGSVLDVRGTKRAYLFNCAFLRSNVEFNAGTRQTTVLIGFECWINDPLQARRLMQFTDPPTESQ